MEADPLLTRAKRKVFAFNRITDATVDLTHEELDALGDEAVKELSECGEPGAERADFLCYKCPAASRCPYVYDLYNRGDSCLADK